MASTHTQRDVLALVLHDPDDSPIYVLLPEALPVYVYCKHACRLMWYVLGHGKVGKLSVEKIALYVADGCPHLGYEPKDVVGDVSHGTLAMGHRVGG